MARPEAVSSPTVNPRTRFKKDPNRHYVLVEVDHGEFDESPIHDLLSKPSETNSEEFKYREESRDPRDTGHRHKALLSCSKEDAEAYARANADAALMGERPVNAKGEVADFTTFTDRRGQVIES